MIDDVYGKAPHVFTEEELVAEENFYWETFRMCTDLGGNPPDRYEVNKFRNEVKSWYQELKC